MTKFDRLLACLVSLAVVALVASAFVPRGRAGDGTVLAADCHDNAALDVVRRGLQFAQGTANAESDRAARLAGSRASLGSLRGEIDHAFSLFKNERERYKALVKSSAHGDKQLANDALKRSGDWLKVEATLRGMYIKEIEHLLKQAQEDRDSAKAARKRSDGWRGLEDELGDMFQDEVKRLKAGPVKARAK